MLNIITVHLVIMAPIKYADYYRGRIQNAYSLNYDTYWRDFYALYYPRA